VNGLEAAIIGLMIAVPQQTAPTIEPDRSAECLALNMYHEARGQGIAGELAVTAVVLNRVNDKRYPDTICEVVEEGPTRASWKDPKVRYPIKIGVSSAGSVTVRVMHLEIKRYIIGCMVLQMQF
jgi:hypothetical protein